MPILEIDSIELERHETSRAPIAGAIAPAWHTIVLLAVTAALAFCAAHDDQSAHVMALIVAFGALFSLIALYRRTLCAGMFAYAWHDSIAVLRLALLRSRHIF